MFEDLKNKANKFGRLVSLYYLGRISEKFEKDLTKSFLFYQEGKQLFEKNFFDFMQNVRTLYFLGLFQKLERKFKKLESL